MLHRHKGLASLGIAGVAAIAFVSIYVLHLPSLSYARESAKATQAAESLPSADQLSTTFESVAAAIKPSVVSISSVKTVAVASQDPFANSPLRDFFDDPMFRNLIPNTVPRDFVQRGLGTGVIVSDDGYILTNNHVVGDADEVQVRLPDGRALKAHVVGTDPKTDLAVIRVQATGLHPARLGDSDQLRVGQWVIAAGNPFGLTSTITAGIVSATGRSNMGINTYEDFIQTDAAINPGNSGGPLVDLHGDVVGINSAIYSRSGGYMGVGFAIPANMAHAVMTSLIEHGRVVRGWLGVEIQDLNTGLAGSFGYNGTTGALIGDVTPGGPAAHAGLERGDVVTRFGGQEVANVARLRDMVAASAPGTSVNVEVFRDGHTREIPVAIGEQPGERASKATPESNEDLGMQLQDLSPGEAQAVGAPNGLEGALVTQVSPLGAAERAGLQPRDVVTGVQGTPVHDVAEFRHAMAQANLDKGVRLDVMTGGTRHYVFLQTERATG